MSPARRDLLQTAFVALLANSARQAGASTEFMKPWGVTTQQYNVLRILRGAGPDGRRSQCIAEDMIHKVPDITRLVDRLVAAGLATRAEDPDDRRAVRVVVTEAGLELLRSMDEPIHDLHEQVLGGLTDQELETLCGLLERVETTRDFPRRP